jgi:hypothetical protein
MNPFPWGHRVSGCCYVSPELEPTNGRTAMEASHMDHSTTGTRTQPGKSQTHRQLNQTGAHVRHGAAVLYGVWVVARR